MVGGKYEDKVTETDFADGEVPSTWAVSTYDWNEQHGSWSVHDFKDHTPEEVEFVKVTCSY